MPISLAAECEHGIRSGFEISMHGSREVHAEERKLRVGHRIDEVANEIATLGPDEVVLTAERYDSAGRILARHAGDAVRMKPRAIHDRVRGQLSCVGRDAPALAVGPDLAHRRT